VDIEVSADVAGASPTPAKKNKKATSRRSSFANMAAPASTPRSQGFDVRKLALGEYNTERDGYIDAWLVSVDNAVRADEFMVGSPWNMDVLYHVVVLKL
jgi:hypothetical protein